MKEELEPLLLKSLKPMANIVINAFRSSEKEKLNDRLNTPYWRSSHRCRNQNTGNDETEVDARTKMITTFLMCMHIHERND